MKNYVFDIDGTICTNTYGEYEKAEPYLERINFINNLYQQNKKIIMFTARGTKTNKNWRKLTENQLKKWGLKYHELIMGKPEGDIFIDDKAIYSETWFSQEFEINSEPKEIPCQENYSKINDAFNSASNCLDKIRGDQELYLEISKAANSIKESLKKGKKVIFAGNGGSFADSQHISAEFISKLNKERGPLASITLGTNSSATTAIANDYGYENIFSRELQALGNSGDTLIAITTSGNSLNIVNLVNKAEEMKINCFILTGMNGGLLKNRINLIKVPSKVTLEIQQIHTIIGHLLCSLAQDSFIN